MPLNIDWQQILLHVFNLIILVTALTFILFKPVRKFMREREEKYKKTAEEHAQKEAELAELDAERQSKIAGLDAELAEHRQKLLAGAESEKSKLLAGAQAEADAILADGRRRVEGEKAAMFAEARGELGEIVVKSAEKLLAIESSPESDKALYDSYLRSVESGTTLSEASRAAAEQARRVSEKQASRAAADKTRAELADMFAEAALEALTRECTPESDGAIYDQFLKTVSGSDSK